MSRVFAAATDRQRRDATASLWVSLHTFNLYEQRLLAAIANQASVALENARLIEDARRANRLKSVRREGSVG